MSALIASVTIGGWDAGRPVAAEPRSRVGSRNQVDKGPREAPASEGRDQERYKLTW